MPVSGLVVTFDAPVAAKRDALEAIQAIPEVETGQALGNKLAIVVDSPTKQRDQEVWNAVRGMEGVTDLAVALVAFDEDEAEEHSAERTVLSPSGRGLGSPRI